MDVMKPIASSDIPLGDEWLYEVKYDGFRCVLSWNKDGSIQLTSKNKKDLTDNFPEIIAFCKDQYEHLKDFLPLQFDGELVVLNHQYQANFSWIQKRGRLKSKDTIQQYSLKRPASFLAFDLLEQGGQSLLQEPFAKRKQRLEDCFKRFTTKNRLKIVHASEDPDHLWNVTFEGKGEGMIAKRKTSKYLPGKGHRDWFKIKNWRTIEGFLTHYDRDNGYFTFAVYDQNKVNIVGKCKHGLNDEEAETLKQIFYKNGTESEKGFSLPPAICASIHTLDLHQNELREPEFAALLPQLQAENCTKTKLEIDLAMIPEHIEVSKTDKVYWPQPVFTKGNLLSYIREISPYMLPFLQSKALTLIRFPEGVNGDFFYQKHLPDYAPNFIDYIESDDGKIILCNNMDSLLWFANHGALEYHIPFQRIDSIYPNEIVFDLDPPDRSAFPLAIQAANIIKRLLDDLQLISLPKTSGNKGIQIHIPIPEGSLTYEDTAIFTQAIAFTVEGAYSNLFTTERMKKNRHGRLYIDYVQHGKDKTIIAPYSPRRTEEGTVATPLFWEEVTEDLRPEQFHIGNVIERVKELGCPFLNYDEIREKQNLNKVIQLIK